MRVASRAGKDFTEPRAACEDERAGGDGFAAGGLQFHNAAGGGGRADSFVAIVDA